MAQETSMWVVDKQVWLGNEIRFFREEDDFFFHAKDVCDSLGIKNSRRVVATIREKYGEVTVREAYAQNVRNQNREAAFIEESIVYCAVIGRSNKPAAVEFSRWMGKVIKTIRQTGRYEADQNTEREIQKLKNENLVLKQKERSDDLEIIKLAHSLFEDDARMLGFVKEKLASMLVTDQKLLTDAAEEWKTVSELMETRYKASIVQKNRSKCGKYVAKKYRKKYGEIKTTVKIVQGHRCDVKIYESSYFEEILGWIADKMNIKNDSLSTFLNHSL